MQAVSDMQKLKSQKSVEWYTPLEFLALVHKVLRTIELDTASCFEANKIVRATRYYDIGMDGLTQSWNAETVFLNPPYCRNQEDWINKLIAEYETGNVQEAILLVNAATETRWFQKLYSYTICFVKGRIHFYGPEDIGSPTIGNAFVYFGKRTEVFIEVFKRVGRIVQAVDGYEKPIGLWEVSA